MQSVLLKVAFEVLFFSWLLVRQGQVEFAGLSEPMMLNQSVVLLCAHVLMSVFRP